MSDDLRARLLRLAIRYHKVIEGEYGCNDETCPGVKRLLNFAESAVREAASALAIPVIEKEKEHDDDTRVDG